MAAEDYEFSGSVGIANYLAIGQGTNSVTLQSNTGGTALLVNGLTAGTRGNTKVVAAAGSGWGADYTCTGVADQVTINAAIAALPSTGGTVVLSDGQFNLADSVSITRSNVRLVAQGRSTLLKIAGAIPGQHIISALGTVGSYLTGVKVQNLRVQGYGDNGNAGAQDHGIQFRYCADSAIQEVWGHDVTWAITNLYDSTLSSVDHVYVEAGTLGLNGGWYGVQAYNGDLGDAYAGHVFSNIQGQPAHHLMALNGIDTASVMNVSASNMVNSDGDPYALNWTTSRRITTTGFVFYKCPGAIYLETTCDDCSFTDGKVILGSAPSAISQVWLDASSGSAVHNVSIDATGQTAGHGIRVSGAGSVRPLLTGNRVTKTFGNGIYTESTATGGNIEGNAVTQAGGDGVNCQGDNSRIVSNHCESNTLAGIHVVGKMATVAENLCVSNGGAGIQDDFGDDADIDGNRLISNTGYGIDISAANADRVRIGPRNRYASNTAGLVHDIGTGTIRLDRISAVSGVPADTPVFGDGDYRLRTDTPGTANQRIYVRSAGAWVAIL